MRTRIGTLFVIALASTVVTAASRAQQPLSPAALPSALDLSPPPAGETNEPYRRAVACELTGDFLPDVFTLRKNSAFLICSPGLFESVIVVPGRVVSDVECVPGSGGQPGRLVIASSACIESCIFNPVLDSFAWAPLFASNTLPAARIIRAANLDGTGAIDYVGVSSDGLSLQTKLASGSGFVDGPAFGTSAPIQELVCADLNGTAGMELVLWTSAALEVYSLDTGSAVLLFSAAGGKGGSLGGLARLPVSGAADQVAWIRGTAGAQQIALLSLPAGQGVQLSTPGSAWTFAQSIVAVRAADLDADGFCDLALSQQSSHHTLLLENTGTGTLPFDSSHFYSVPLRGGTTLAQPHNETNPILVDMDLDGDVDIAQVVQNDYPTDQDLLDVRSMQLVQVEAALRPTLDTSNVWIREDVFSPYYAPYAEANQGQWSWALSFHTNIANAPADATDVEYVLWKRNGLGVETPDLALGSTFVPKGSQSGNDYLVDLPIQEAAFPFATHYLFTERYVVRDPSTGVVTKVYPGWTFLGYGDIGLSDSTGYYSRISGALPWQHMLRESGGGVGQTGGITPSPYIPDFTQNKSPKKPHGL